MDILSILNEHNLWQNIKDQKPFIFKQTNLPEVTWDEILEVVSLDVIAGKRMNRGVNGYGELGFKILYANRVKKINDQLELLSPYFDNSPDFQSDPNQSHQLYISLSIDETSYGREHKDPENVIFWQLRGNSIWNIWNKEDTEIEFTYELSMGDIIYCPPERQHHVIAKTPRAGISFGFGSLKSNI